MTTRRHLCCYIQDEVHVGCDEVATAAVGSLYSDRAPTYSCDDHRRWLRGLPHPNFDTFDYKLVHGFDPRLNTVEEIDVAVQILVEAGAL